VAQHGIAIAVRERKRTRSAKEKARLWRLMKGFISIPLLGFVGSACEAKRPGR
jgi:hypothetical protein